MYELWEIVSSGTGQPWSILGIAVSISTSIGVSSLHYYENYALATVVDDNGHRIVCWFAQYPTVKDRN